MRVVLRVSQAPAWLKRVHFESPAAAELSKAELLRQLMNAALATPYYSRRDRAEALLCSSTLEEVPATPLRDLFDFRPHFTNPRAKPRKPRFSPPFASENAAVLGPAMQVPRGGKSMDADALPRLHLGDAKMLAATPPLLRRICAAVEAQTMALPHLDEAVVVLNSVTDGALFECERDMLWRCLGVPVFEQWLGLDGELLASECVAHQGLHWNPSTADFEIVDRQLAVTSYLAHNTPLLRLETGLRGEIDTGPCPCGRTGPRLLNLRQAKRVENLTALSAVAS